MADDAKSQSEKTEKPSAKKLREAREQGNVPRSRDLTVALSSLAVTVALTKFGAGALATLGQRLGDGLTHMSDHAIGTMTSGELAGLAVHDVLLMGAAVGPIMLVAAITGVAGTVMQSGWVFAPSQLQFHWEKLSPAEGLKRLKPSQSGVDLLKAIIAVVALSMLAYKIGRALVDESPMFAWMAPADAALAGWARMSQLMWQVGFALLAIAAADFGMQHWRRWQSLKMTKQEVRDEAKGSEGSPEMKGKIRRIQRDMTRRRMLTAVKQATVVVTNPTHYAVALEYRREKMAAPVVVAKGKDLLAARIKKIAREAGVPIVENVSLAQALFKGAEVGDQIPSALFGAVAEVLAYLVRIKQLML
jgi:flagellar biosynthetic protein FlhB